MAQSRVCSKNNPWEPARSQYQIPIISSTPCHRRKDNRDQPKQNSHIRTDTSGGNCPIKPTENRGNRRNKQHGGRVTLLLASSASAPCERRSRIRPRATIWMLMLITPDAPEATTVKTVARRTEVMLAAIRHFGNRSGRFLSDTLKHRRK